MKTDGGLISLSGMKPLAIIGDFDVVENFPRVWEERDQTYSNSVLNLAKKLSVIRYPMLSKVIR